MSPPPDPLDRPADWEAFYRDYRKPGYVAGFEITSKLGGGMFGLVFRARRMSIGKDYAIKFLQVEDESVRKAVLAELEQVKWFAQIDHPNLVSIEDRGEVDGIPYLVMAFAGTETLRDRMPAGREPTAVEKDELMRCFLQACRGLAALHERSLVHFDVKPANVFLKGGVARVGDYGLSKLVTHSRGSLSMGRGTPYYMAPELLQRRGDHRSDVYSLGVLLYELLCGRVPFTGDSEWEVLKKHETTPPELPPHLTDRERAVLQRCLHKDPAARFQSVHDLIAAFGAPAGVGAAAWSDVRTARPAGPGAVPPPLPAGAGSASADEGEQDPVAGIGRASRDVLRHANVLAQRGAKEAGRIAQQAAQSAQRAVRDAVDRSRTYGWRRWLAVKKLHARHPEHAQRGRAFEVAAEVAAGARPPRRARVARGLVTTVAVTVAVGFVLVLLMPARVLRSGGPRPYPAPSATASAMVADVPVGDRTFASIQPGAYALGVHTTEEPKWVRIAALDAEAAKQLLKEHAEQLRQLAPLTARQRARAGKLPRFELSPAQNAESLAEHSLFDELLRRPLYDDDLASTLAERAPRSLVVAAQKLQQVRWQSRADVERARRLQQWLEQTTCCHELQLYAADDRDLAVVAARNAHLGTLWLWFVNEFAHTPRTWATYRSLMGR